MGRFLSSLLGAVSVSLACPALAQLPSEDSETAVGIALGTGVRAAATSTTALAVNPAALPVGNLYHLEAFAGYDSDPGRWDVGSAVADSTVRWAAAGFSFRGILAGSDGNYQGMDAKLGLGVPILDVVSIGLAGRYLKLRRHGPLEEDQKRSLIHRFTMDVAIQLHLANIVKLAFLASNIIDTHKRSAPRMLGGSVAVEIGELLVLGADAFADLTSYRENTENPKTALRLGGGAEFRVGGLRLRTGYLYVSRPGDRGLHAVTGGVGYETGALGVDVGLRQFVSPDPASEGILSFRYFVR